MKKKTKKDNGDSECEHKNVREEGGDLICQDCGLILDDKRPYKDSSDARFFSDSQSDYERRIRKSDARAMQDPKVKQKYDKINTLNKWFQDYQSNFTEQKKTIELLKSYGIGLNIDNVKYKEIKDRYLKYNKYHRHTYQNMVIIFLAIVWMAIKDTTNIRVEQFIGAAQELGHKINKKMLNNAMHKVRRTEDTFNKQTKTVYDLVKEIKEKIKILFQKDLNQIPFEEVKSHFESKVEYQKLKLEMQKRANKILNQISYRDIQNLNYKAFTAGLIYYIGQTLENTKIFTQYLIEKSTKFSSTTIRKKFNILKEILGDPEDFN
ncbi:MAG: TFIIB-type zinc ribbon-containing protein [Promethearchaeota archaeon]|nr:MAG: TFIIB-type zinc ribbon-containing protein [Candidatus Lokiarchaeota archaeon]